MNPWGRSGSGADQISARKGGEDASHFHDEHHRVLHHRLGMGSLQLSRAAARGNGPSGGDGANCCSWLRNTLSIAPGNALPQVPG